MLQGRPQEPSCGVLGRPNSADWGFLRPCLTAPEGVPVSEGDVVFGAATATTGGGAFEVGGVGRDVAAGGESATTVAAAPTTGAVAGAEELDRVGDDLDRLPFAAAVFGLPLTPVEAPFDRYGPTLAEVVGAVLTLCAP